MDRQIENLKKELKSIGIHSQGELEEAIRALPPLSLYIMTGDLKTVKGEPGNVQKKR